MRKQAAIYLEGRSPEFWRNESGKFFLVGERKVSFWKNGDRIKKRLEGRKGGRFLKRSTDSMHGEKRELAAHIENGGERGRTGDRWTDSSLREDFLL